MDVILGLGLFASIMVIAWLVVRSQFAFIVKLKVGKAHLASGKVTTAFLHQVEQTCVESNVASGWIAGTLHGRRMKLSFSRSIPAPVQQRLRNLWHLQG